MKVQSELRDEKGNRVNSTLQELIYRHIEEMYTEFEDTSISYDTLHLLICDASHQHRIFNIALKSKS